MAKFGNLKKPSSLIDRASAHNRHGCGLGSKPECRSFECIHRVTNKAGKAEKAGKAGNIGFFENLAGTAGNYIPLPEVKAGKANTFFIPSQFFFCIKIKAVLQNDGLQLLFYHVIISSRHQIVFQEL